MKVQEAKALIMQVPLYRYECELEKGRQSDLFQALNMCVQALEEVEQYRALGTVEELKEAREKQMASKWIECPYADLIMCPSCNAEFSTIDNCTEQFEYCPKCGKRLE